MPARPVEAGYRVLVVGGRGMLGGEVCRYLRSLGDFHVDATGRRSEEGSLDLDVRRGAEGIEPILRQTEYHLVVNCVGILKPDIDRKDPEAMQAALLANAVWPHALAAAASQAGTRVVHMSTDGVFIGNTAPAYYEDDPPDSADDYGWMKALGEPDCEACLSIRCSIIGTDPARGRGLVEWVRSLGEGSEVEGYEDHRWNGVTTHQFAQLCEAIVRRGTFRGLRNRSRVYHFCPNPEITKAKLVGLLSEVLGKDLRVRGRPATGGPMNRVLGTRFTDLTMHVKAPADWRQVIRETLQLRDKKPTRRL